MNRESRDYQHARQDKHDQTDVYPIHERGIQALTCDECLLVNRCKYTDGIDKCPNREGTHKPPRMSHDRGVKYHERGVA